MALVSSGAEKKNNLIEAAPFGHLDQMLSTIILGRALPPQPKTRGQRPPAKIEKIGKIIEKFRTKKCFFIFPGLGSQARDLRPGFR